jgi:hypothetical protein
LPANGFDPGDAIVRAAIREQVGSTVKRLHRDAAIENVGAWCRELQLLDGPGRGRR